MANRMLKGRGGGLELVRPQPVVARSLSLSARTRALLVRSDTDAEPQDP